MKINFLAILVAFFALISSFVSSAIRIDGILNEDEWISAQRITDFYEVYPYSLRDVEDLKTEILIFEDEKGIYFCLLYTSPSPRDRG